MSSGTSTPADQQPAGSSRFTSTASSLSASLIRARPYRFSTQVVTVENPDAAHKDQHGSSSVPIYQTATFKGMGGSYDYSRSGNPTRTHLEHHIAKVSGSKHAFAVSSGMAALDIICKLISPGDHVIAGNDLYGGTNRLLTYLGTNGGIKVHHVDTTVTESLRAPLESGARVSLVLLETPTNPLLQIADIIEIAKLVRATQPHALIAVDNTMMSPYMMRPLELGVDIVYDSATKYLSGHHDLMAGVITCNRDDVAKRIAFAINSVGNGLPPFDSFLLLRGMKTLALRFDRMQATAMSVATYLHALGFKVNYPGLPGHPGKEVHDKMARGAGAVLSFETGDTVLSERIVGATRLWGISVSFGCVNSLISMPCLMSHASIDPKVRAERNLPEDLIRLCVGIEDPDDLLEDLEAALLEAGAVRAVDETASKLKLERVAPIDSVATIAQGVAASSLEPASQTVDRLVVSAPGKVILFGEHAVVHGITAIAGSLDLRSYCMVDKRADGLLSLALPDLAFERTWDIASLPWDLVRHAAPKPPSADAALDTGLLAAIVKNALGGCDGRALAAGTMFLYLYMHISQRSKLSQSFVVRSCLPIGAGLGSSAAISVALASAMLYTNAHLPLPAAASAVAANALHSGRRSISPEHADAVNGWAFVAEKVCHGTPSGIDNTVATFGGAIAYKKALNGEPGSQEGLYGFKSIRLLLTDTRVPRDTKSLVAGVAKRKRDEPDTINATFKSIQSIADEARRCLVDSDLPRSRQLAILSALVCENHEHLVSLGVSHASLEAVRARTADHPWRLPSKLTGAGGGGCAVTLVPDDFAPEALEQLKESLAQDGFDAFEAAVGGAGFGVAVLPAADERATVEGGAEDVLVPASAKFRSAARDELKGWVESHGEWMYA